MATEAELKELQELLESHDTALLTTRGADGHFHTRPMGLQARAVKDGLWFATWDGSEKVIDLELDPHCGVTLYKGGRDSTYVSLSGQAQIVRDKAEIRRQWSDAWRPWFPNGPDEAQLTLIRFVPDHAEYVHPTTGRMHVLFTAARRLVTRQQEELPQKHDVDLQ
jgi:general stress protein 26